MTSAQRYEAALGLVRYVENLDRGSSPCSIPVPPRYRPHPSPPDDGPVGRRVRSSRQGGGAGLDGLAFAFVDEAGLRRWAAHLSAVGIAHRGATPADGGLPLDLTDLDGTDIDPPPGPTDEPASSPPAYPRPGPALPSSQPARSRAIDHGSLRGPSGRGPVDRTVGRRPGPRASPGRADRAHRLVTTGDHGHRLVRPASASNAPLVIAPRNTVDSVAGASAGPRCRRAGARTRRGRRPPGPRGRAG